MFRKLKSGEYRLYSRKKHAKTNKRKNLGTFKQDRRRKNMNRKFNILKGTSVPIN